MLIISLFSIFPIFSFEPLRDIQTPLVFDQDQGLKDMYIVDTVMIEEPILVEFSGKRRKEKQRILVSKNSLNIEQGRSNEFRKFITEKGQLFFPPNRFACLINNYMSKRDNSDNDDLYRLQKQIRTAYKDVVWKNVDGRVLKSEHLGWTYFEIIQNEFIVCLVKGSALLKCQTLDEIVIKDLNNLYFKVLIPITW